MLDYTPVTRPTDGFMNLDNFQHYGPSLEKVSHFLFTISKKFVLFTPFIPHSPLQRPSPRPVSRKVSDTTLGRNLSSEHKSVPEISHRNTEKFYSMTHELYNFVEPYNENNFCFSCRGRKLDTFNENIR